MLLTDLSAVDELRVVERAHIDALIDELELSRSDFVDPGRAVVAGRGLGARWMVTGAIVSVAPNLRVDAHVVDVETSQIVGSRAVTGPQADFFLLEKELALGLLAELGVTPDARETVQLSRVSTESFAAFRLWSESLDALDRGEVDAAAAKLKAALGEDGDFRAAKAALDGMEAAVETAVDLGQTKVGELARELVDKIGSAPVTELPDIVGIIPPREDQFSLEEQRQLARAILDRDLPEDVLLPISFRSRASLNHYALATYTIASSNAGHAEEAMSYGQRFLARYPASPAFTRVKTAVDTSLAAQRAQTDARAAYERDRDRIDALPICERARALAALSNHAEAARTWEAAARDKAAECQPDFALFNALTAFNVAMATPGHHQQAHRVFRRLDREHPSSEWTSSARVYVQGIPR